MTGRLTPDMSTWIGVNGHQWRITGLICSWVTTRCKPCLIASVMASPSGSLSPAVLNCWNVKRNLLCSTILWKDLFLPTAVNMARKMGFPPLWSNLRTAANRTSLSSSRRSTKHNLTQSSCRYPFKTVRPNLCFLLVFTTEYEAKWLCLGFRLFLVRHPCRQFVTATFSPYSF